MLPAMALSLSLSLFGGNNEVAELAYQTGNKLFEDGKHEAALGQYLECLRLVKDHQDALFNGGLAAYLAGKLEKAVELWERLRELKPNDTHVLAKLVQAYEAMGKRAKRDEARKSLFDARAALSEEDRAELEKYCREQFQAGDTKIMAFEYFELKGDWAVRYRFSALDAKGKEDYWISLGSYEMTTAIAREQGTIGKEERMWHLDRYRPDRSHETLALLTKEPTYDEARRKVIEAVTGKKQPATKAKKAPEGTERAEPSGKGNKGKSK